jgi:hypothetical protein
MNDDIRRILDAAGERPVASPDPAFAEALEARLLAVAASIPEPTPASAPLPVRRSGPARLRLALAGGLLAATAAVGILLAVVAGSAGPVVPPELTAPVNVEVALIDGTVLEDPDGLRLPEGAVIRVGEGGSARIGDTILEPGDVATVEQGRLTVERDQPVGALPGGSAGVPGAGATPSRRPTTAPSATSAGRTPSPRPAATPSVEPPTASPGTLPTPAPTSEPGTPQPTRSTPQPTAAPSPVIERPRIRARVLFDPTRIRVAWTATPGAASYVLVRTGSRDGAAPRPQYPGSRIVGEFSRPPATALRLWVPLGVVEVKLLVVALAPDGTVLARSRIVTLSTVPPVATVPSPTPDPSASESPTPAIGE